MTLAQAAQHASPKAVAYALNEALRRDMGASDRSAVIDELMKLQQRDAREAAEKETKND